MSDLSDLYQELILDHNKRPRNKGALSDANRTAQGHNPLCGDHVTVYLKLKDNVVEEVTFEGSGCAISTASASLMTESLRGKTLDEARELFKKFHGLVTGEAKESREDQNGLGKLEVFCGVCQYPTRVKCATLAWHTVHQALEDSSEVASTE